MYLNRAKLRLRREQVRSLIARNSQVLKGVADSEASNLNVQCSRPNDRAPKGLVLASSLLALTAILTGFP